MTISIINDIVVALAIAQRIKVLKNITVPKAIGSYQSSWLGVGVPGAGATPPAYTAGSGYTANKSTVGALKYSNGAVQNWLAKLFATSTIAGTLFLYDRLWSCSGMGFAAGTYTVTTPGTLPARITDAGLGCELWVEQNNAAAGSATGTLIANYKNIADGAEAGTIPVVVSAPVIGQMQPVPLATGATGVRSLVSVVTNQTWTSGTFGMTICKQIAAIPIPLAGVGYVLDWASLGLPPIPADACLFFIWQGGAATANQIMASLDIIDK
jgi:hypothetical protein